MPRVSDEVLSIFTKFHREVVLPDIQRVVGESEQRIKHELSSEIQTAFDGLAQRLERLEVEYQILVAGVQRLEERMDHVEGRLESVDSQLRSVDARLSGLEQRLDRGALKSEVLELEARVEILERKIAALDAQL